MEILPVAISGMKRCSTIRWRPVLAVVAGFLQQGMSWGFLMVYGSQYKYFEDTLFEGYSRVQLAAPGAMAAGLVLLFSVFQGRLCDNHWHRATNVAGSTCFVSGILLLAFGSGSGEYGEGNYTNVMLSYLLQGIGQSTFFVTSSHLAASWYPVNPGLPIGITSCGVAVAGIVWPLLFTDGAARWGFRIAVSVMAAAAAGCCVFICIFGMPNPDQPRRPVQKPLKVKTWLDPVAFKDAEWCFATASMCFIYLGLLGLPQFLETWAEARGLVRTDSSAVILLTIATGSSLVGRLGGTLLGNRYGFRLVHATCNFLIMIVTLSFWPTARQEAHGVVFAVIFGIFQGAIIALPPADIKEIIEPRRTEHGGKPRVKDSMSHSNITTAVNSTLSLECLAVPLQLVDSNDESSAEQKVISSQLGQCPGSMPASSKPGTDPDIEKDLAQHNEGCEAIAAVRSPQSFDSRTGLSSAQERRAKLGGWLGTSFLCAAPFAVAGPLLTSAMVSALGISSVGYFTGACYGASSLSLLLSLLATRMKRHV